MYCLENAADPAVIISKIIEKNSRSNHHSTVVKPVVAAYSCRPTVLNTEYFTTKANTVASVTYGKQQ